MCVDDVTLIYTRGDTHTHTRGHTHGHRCTVAYACTYMYTHSHSLHHTQTIITVVITPSAPVLFENQSASVFCNSSLSSSQSVVWLRDGVPLTGETNTTLMISSVPLEWNNSLLTCIVDGDGNSTVRLTVYCECSVCVCV